MEKELVQPVITWFVLSLIIAGIAQGKNRSGFGWWLFGIITGPFALFCLVVFAGKLKSNNNESDEKPEDKPN